MASSSDVEEETDTEEDDIEEDSSEGELVDDLIATSSNIIVSYPAFEWQGKANGVTITIQAGEDILPEGTEVHIEPVERNTIRDVLADDGDDLLIAFDIQFLWEGEEIQPLSEITVTFEADRIPEDAEIFHIADDSQVETIENISDKGGIAEFSAEHFSVYGVRAGGGQSLEPFANPTRGGTEDGDWKGSYAYYGWWSRDDMRTSDYYYSLRDEASSLELNKLHTWNGEKYLSSNKRAPIKWRVLQNDGNSLLLLADDILSVHNYSDMRSSGIPTWKDSTMRSWLRDIVVPSMFSEEEQGNLCDSVVDDPVSALSGLQAGETTVDEIFLPSWNDMTNPDYGFPADGASKSRKADYMYHPLKINNTANDNSYWLRTRSMAPYGLLYPHYVVTNGDCMAGANRYYTWLLGVRPMIRVSIGSEFLGTSEDDESLYYGMRFDCAEKTIQIDDSYVLAPQGEGLSFTAGSLEWGSSNTGIVEIDDQGKMTARAIGTAFVYAHSGRHFAGCKVTVVPRTEEKEYNVVFKDGETILASQTVAEGQSATAPTPTKVGYVLSWDKDFSHVTSDMTVNAVWTAAASSYNIYYELNGGINSNLNPSTYKFGEVTILQRPEKPDCDFLGWYTTENFESGTAIQIITAEMAGDITVYAKWESKTQIYKVEFISEGKVIDTQMVAHGHAAVAPELEPRKGYVFLGWSEDYNYVTRDMKITAIWMSETTGKVESGGSSDSDDSDETQTRKTVIRDLYFNVEAVTGFILHNGEKRSLKDYLIVEVESGDEEKPIELIWKSSKPEVASVDASGNVNCISDGFATIMVSPASNAGMVARVLVRSVEKRVNDPTGKDEKGNEDVGKHYYENTPQGWDLPNCTTYAWGRAFEIIGVRPNLSINNAYAWLTYNHNGGAPIYKAGAEPKSFSIGCTTNANHVIVVEDIVDGKVMYSQSSYGGFGKSNNNDWGIDEKNEGGGKNTSKFVYGSKPGYSYPAENVKIKYEYNYIYLDLNPYRDNLTRAEQITGHSVHLAAAYKYPRSASRDIKETGYYIGTKRSQLKIGKVCSGGIGDYEVFDVENLQPNTTYYYQFFVRGTNDVEYRGHILDFTTSP